MAIDLASVDEVLATTRSVRRRLDLTRPVADELVRECIDLAEQAPTGGDLASRRWLVIRDPEVKAKVAELYRASGGTAIMDLAARLRGTGSTRERVVASGAHLAEHLDEVPVLVLVTIWGEHDGRGTPGLFDSVLQAAWSFCLAARARGLGTAWTSMHLARRDEMAALLGIPGGVSQLALLPVAHTTGGDFHRAKRRPAKDITYYDRWGYTAEHSPADAIVHLADGPGVTVEIDIDARPRVVWELVSDVTIPARFSDELYEVERIDDTMFVGRNRMKGLDWETTSYIVERVAPRVFAWNVVDPERPGASWRFELDTLGASGERTRLRQHVTIGPGVSGTSTMIEQEPEREQAILGWRRHLLARNMQRTVEGIKALAEGTA